MCGRIVLAKDPIENAGFFQLSLFPERILEPDYNLAPSKEVYIIVDKRAEDGTHQRALEIARWGLVPSWAKDPAIGNRLTNARSETVSEKPSFREAFARRRCLVPVDGYYEWYASAQETAPGRPRKQPFYLHDPQERPLAIAGLYEWWRAGPSEPWLLTCTLLTRAATPDLARIHDRMPVIVPPHQWGWWLDNSQRVDVNELAPAVLEAHAVSTAVNSSRSSGPALIEPIAFDWE
ncbi:MAG: SOS response-associated peptidase [Candidatus Nanopelagicales bacterium]